MRNHTAATIDAGIHARELAPLLRRLADLSREIAALDAADPSAGKPGKPTGVAAAVVVPDERF